MSMPVRWGVLSTAAIAGTVYRIELDRVSRAIRDGEPLPFGRDDAAEQAATLAAVDESARTGRPVGLTAAVPS